MSRIAVSAMTGALLLMFLAQAVSALQYMSVTIDEPVYITSGYAYWQTRDDRINGEHPPLMKMLLTIPLLPLHLGLPLQDQSWQNGQERPFSDRFLYQDPDRLNRIVDSTRLVAVGFGLLLALAVRAWAAAMWGPEAGIAALFFCVFEPNIIANASLATLDIGVTTLAFLAMYVFWKWCQRGNWRHAAGAGILFGCALASKATAAVFVPVMVVQLVGWRAVTKSITPSVLGFAGIVAGSLVVVAMVYTLTFGWHSGRSPAKPPAAGAETVSRPPVADFVKGTVAQLKRERGGDRGFLLGRRSSRGWWYYYLVAFGLKTPVPLLILGATRLGLLSWLPMTAEEGLFIVLPIVAVLGAFSLNRVDLGVRYLLPLYPFLCVWISRVVVWIYLGQQKTPEATSLPGCDLEIVRQTSPASK
jgi:4-amino-4-deoxy-L-arabinose transferase-like glycosyltransferase